jgi:hypothetical protein
MPARHFSTAVPALSQLLPQQVMHPGAATVYYPTEQQQPVVHNSSTASPSPSAHVRPLFQAHNGETNPPRTTSPPQTLSPTGNAAANSPLLSHEHIISKQYQMINSLHTVLDCKDQVYRETQALLEHERVTNESLVLSLRQSRKLVAKVGGGGV